MTQSILLFASENGETPFNRERIVGVIESVVETRSADRSATSCLKNDNNIVWKLVVNDSNTYPIQIVFLGEQGSISVETFHEMGLQAAIDIQRAYEDEVYAWSEEASPLLAPISAINTPGELATILKLR